MTASSAVCFSFSKPIASSCPALYRNRSEGSCATSQINCDELHAHFLLGEAGDDLRQLLSESSKANRIARTIAHIRTNLEGGSSIDQLVEISGMSNSTLHVEFKQATGKTPLQFQKELRLLEARSRLASDGAPVSEVAYSVGYSSPTQFSRDYRAKFGVSPREHRAVVTSELT